MEQPLGTVKLEILPYNEWLPYTNHDLKLRFKKVPMKPITISAVNNNSIHLPDDRWIECTEKKEPLILLLNNHSPLEVKLVIDEAASEDSRSRAAVSP